MRNRMLVACTLLCVLFGGMIVAQQSDTILTADEMYLSAVEGVIIKGLATTEGRDSKQVALQYIERAIAEGRRTEDMQIALEQLASEGINSVVRESGRTMNNYPDIRMKAAELLGDMATTRAKDTLIQVMYADNEPSVITAAVRSLGKLGYNDNDEVVEMINWVTRKFDIILPTSSLALEILNTYEVLAPSVKNKTPMIESIVRIANNYNYVTPVRTRAYQVLQNISGNNRNSGR